MKRFRVTLDVTTTDTFRFLGKDLPWTAREVKGALKDSFADAQLMGQESSVKKIRFVGRGKRIK